MAVDKKISYEQARKKLNKAAPKGHQLAFITPEEANLLKSKGASGEMTKAGIRSYRGHHGSRSSSASSSSSSSSSSSDGPGRRGGGSNRQPNLFGNTPVNTPQGIGGMTPGPGPGGQMVAGATPPSAGQAAAQGGTTAGFAGRPGGGGGGQRGGGQSLQDLFAAQQPPAQGITTLPNTPNIPTDQGVMFGPPAPPPSFFNRPDLPTFGFAFEDVYGEETPAYESGETVLDNLKNILDSINPEFDLGPGTLDINIDPFEQEGGINFTVPLGPQSSLVNPDTSGIMQASNVLGTTPIGMNQLELDEQRKQIQDEINTPNAPESFRMPVLEPSPNFDPQGPGIITPFDKQYFDYLRDRYPDYYESI